MHVIISFYFCSFCRISLYTRNLRLYSSFSLFSPCGKIPSKNTHYYFSSGMLRQLAIDIYCQRVVIGKSFSSLCSAKLPIKKRNCRNDVINWMFTMAHIIDRRFRNSKNWCNRHDNAKKPVNVIRRYFKYWNGTVHSHARSFRLRANNPTATD